MPSSTEFSPARPPRNKGFTVVELIVGMVLLSALVIGMNNLWVVVDDYFFRLQLRQKAVLKLNGEMERLAAFGRFTDLFGQPATYADSATTVERWLYRADPPNITAGMVVTVNTLTSVATNTFTDDQVLFYNSGATNLSTDENILWLDRDNNVTAKFEWEVFAAETATCFSPGCFRIEGRVTYPYRYGPGVAPAQTTMGTIQTISIRTMIGRRL